MNKGAITVNPGQRTRLLFLLIFVVSTGLRLGLVAFNRQSNDDHFTVIQRILTTHRLPQKADCWECYQPKLFHFAAAKFLEFASLDGLSQTMMILTVELVNFVAGLIINLVIGIFMLRLPVKNRLLKILAFGLVALNSSLIGINSQITNDTFAILFSTLALFSMYSFLQSRKPLEFAGSTIFTLLAISSKTNGWITAIAIFLALLIRAWAEKQHLLRTIGIAGLFALITLAVSILNPLNQYISNDHNYGSPILLNIRVLPFPRFIKQTPINAPGILSIQDGIFTFKFIDLLRNPRIQNDSDYSPNRTSLWTQLYGRANSVHFDNWPGSWSTSGEQGLALSRTIFVLALLPAALLLIGALILIYQSFKAILKRDQELLSETQYGLTAAVFTGFILFIIFYALVYRDYSVMKAIFIYPAIITFPILFLKAGEILFSRLNGRLHWLQAGFGIWIVALFILYSADIITMIALLYSRRFSS